MPGVIVMYVTKGYRDGIQSGLALLNYGLKHFGYCQPSSFWLVHTSLAATRVSDLLLSVHFLYQLISFIPHNERKLFLCV